MKRIGIIGAGRFGSALAEILAEHGAEILLIDSDHEVIQRFSEFVSQAVEGDVTNVRTLEEAGFQNCDVVVVAIGTNIEGSIMATVNCKDLGVPVVVAKANSDLHGKILQRVGADKVFFPNRDCAKRIACTLLSKGFVDLFEISDGFNIAEIDAPEMLHNKSLAEAKTRSRLGVTVLCLRRVAEDRGQPRVVIIPAPTEVIRPDDKLLVFGLSKHIEALSQE
jgi:trk system potassium uptake protein TrkA